MRTITRWTALACAVVALVCCALRPAAALADELLPGDSAESTPATATAPSSQDSTETTPAPPPPPPTPRPVSITLLAAGDLMCHADQLAYARTREGYDFWPSFATIAPVISAADVAVGNLETTLRPGSYSGYPTFKSPRSYATALKRAGFDVLTTANNHALDGGSLGVRYTAIQLGSLGIASAGTNGRRSVVVSRKGIRIAILPYTYGTNGLRSPFSGAVSYLKMAGMRADIARAKRRADVVVVYLHVGEEYSKRPESKTRETARRLIDSGADLVLGSHPHVVRPVETYKGRYIVYSLGNFISGQRRAYTDLGAIARVKITKRGRTTRVSGLEMTPVYRQKSPGKGRATYRVVTVDKALAGGHSGIGASERAQLRSYRALCRDLFGRYY